MHRFFSPRASIRGNSITISSSEQLHHMKHTLRLKKGDRVCVFDEKNDEYEAVIEELRDLPARLSISARRARRPAPRIQLTIACALPKKARMDDIIDKLTQLNVARIIPLRTERVVVKWDTRQERAHEERWRKIAVSACQQSGRSQIPQIDQLFDFGELLQIKDQFDLKLIPTLGEGYPSINKVIDAEKPSRILAVIGPEGDFSADEVARAQARGFLPVSLGSCVLRVDTAALSVAAYLHFHAES